MKADRFARFYTLPDPAQRAEFYQGVPAKRLIAWVIDCGIILGLSIAASIATFGIGFFIFFALSTVIAFLYRWQSLAAGSATLGMRIMAIELREQDGRRLTSGTAFAHTALYMIGATIFPIQLASIVMMVTSQHGRSLPDMLTGTAMINKPLY